jgi:hypothetical protein
MRNGIGIGNLRRWKADIVMDNPRPNCETT